MLSMHPIPTLPRCAGEGAWWHRPVSARRGEVCGVWRVRLFVDFARRCSISVSRFANSGYAAAMSDIPTIAEAAKLIAARKLSPLELTRACLDRVRALDGALHSFLLLTEERALADAQAAEAAIMANGPRGRLHGIPIGLKDIVDTKGIRTTCHSAILRDNVPDTDATCATKLAEAGTVLMGKTATHEFADGGPSFDLPWPPARNPWNTEHFTAGSSSGTGAGVAAGLIRR